MNDLKSDYVRNRYFYETSHIFYFIFFDFNNLFIKKIVFKKSRFFKRFSTLIYYQLRKDTKRLDFFRDDGCREDVKRQ